MPVKVSWILGDGNGPMYLDRFWAVINFDSRPSPTPDSGLIQSVPDTGRGLLLGRFLHVSWVAGSGLIQLCMYYLVFYIVHRGYLVFVPFCESLVGKELTTIKGNGFYYWFKYFKPDPNCMSNFMLFLMKSKALLALFLRSFTALWKLPVSLMFRPR